MYSFRKHQGEKKGKITHLLQLSKYIFFLVLAIIVSTVQFELFQYLQRVKTVTKRLKLIQFYRVFSNLQFILPTEDYNNLMFHLGTCQHRNRMMNNRNLLEDNKRHTTQIKI